MTLALVVADSRRAAVDILHRCFAQVASVEVIESDPAQFLSNFSLDAVMLMSALAHERLGGTLTPGLSQVLPTGQAAGLPRLVVTTAPQPLSIDDIESDGSARRHTSPWDTFGPALDAVARFNQNRATGEQIRRLGIHFELLNAGLDQIATDAGALLAAYRSMPHRQQ
jgi:hypothetical protein